MVLVKAENFDKVKVSGPQYLLDVLGPTDNIVEITTSARSVKSID